MVRIFITYWKSAKLVIKTELIHLLITFLKLKNRGIDETLKGIHQHKGVEGAIVLDGTGKSSAA